MLCFNHAGMQAVGVCKSCMKGLCPDCVIDSGKGLVCNETCGKNVLVLSEHNRTVVNQGKEYYSRTAIVYLVTGPALIALAYSFFNSSLQLASIGFAIPGIVIFILGLKNWQARKG